MRLLSISAILFAVAANAELCFPGSPSIDSPTHDYRIEWEEPTDGETHQLFLRKLGQNAERRHLLGFVRSACVYWAPTEDTFALTLNSGSNVSETFIYSIHDVARPINVAELIPARIKEQLQEYLHVYVKTESWTHAGLAITITAHGHEDHDERTIHERMVCINTGNDWRCGD